MKTLIKHATKRSYLPILNTIAVHEGMAIADDMDNRVIMPCDLPNGLYDAQMMKAGINKLSYDRVPDDFPQHRPLEGGLQYTSVSIDDLAWVNRAASTEDARYYLNGVYFNAEGMTATDGHRLHQLKGDGAACAKPFIMHRDTITLCAAMCKELKADKVTIECYENGSIRVLIGNSQIISKEIDGTFPDYTRVIPTNYTLSAPINCDDFKLIAKEAKELTKARGLRGDGVVILSQDPVKYYERVDKTWLGGPRINREIGINPAFVFDAGLQGVIQYPNEGNGPVVITQDNKLAVIMPVRVRGAT